MSAHVLPVKHGVQIELVSIAWMTVEAIVAILAGVFAHSLSLVAFGADSVIELVAGGVLLWRLTLELRGANLDAVRRAETKSSWVVGISLLLLAVYIVAASIDKLVTHQGAQTSWLGIALAVASSLVMPYLSKSKKRIGSEIGSKALRSDGACSMVCAYMAWILLAASLLTTLLGWWWIDSIASLALVYYVAKEGFEAIEAARGKDDACGCCH